MFYFSSIFQNPPSLYAPHHKARCKQTGRSAWLISNEFYHDFFSRPIIYVVACHRKTVGYIYTFYFKPDIVASHYVYFIRHKFPLLSYDAEFLYVAIGKCAFWVCTGCEVLTQPAAKAVPPAVAIK